MSELNTYNIYALGERAAVIELGNTISEQLNNKVLAMRQWVELHPFEGLKDVVPAYSSLTILYDPYTVSKLSTGATAFAFVKQKLEQAWLSDEEVQLRSKNISIPVCYDPEFGHDLKLMAAGKNLDIDELIEIHCSVAYRVYMLGFLPGFAYMGKVDERLVMPRRSVPRENVEAGSVGIAGWQTGIYPLNSPGGWQIIGRTPVKLFNAQAEPPVVIAAGDTVHFYSISPEQFREWEPNNNYVAQHS